MRGERRERMESEEPKHKSRTHTDRERGASEEECRECRSCVFAVKLYSETYS